MAHHPKKHPKFYNHPRAGYSLIELAVVLVIIGLIAGAVMKGRDLIESARLKSIYAQIQNYRIANTAFLDRYGALPGDFDQASTMIHTSLKDGNNDNIISGQGLDNNSETFQYWAHLAKAELISDPGNPAGSTPGFGRGAPKTKLGGGITISYNPDNLKGHWFTLGTRNGSSGQGALLTPKQAFFLNQTFDNGDPNTGDIQIRQGQGDGIGHCFSAQQGYNFDEDRPACVAYFKF